MKYKFTVLVFLMFCSVFAVKANLIKITVSSFQFNPANVTANIGDTLEWDYINGNHTTTSVSVPAGAAAWDAPMNAAGDTFRYVLKIAGTYNYHCSIHPVAMIGVITVNGALPVVLTRFSVDASKIAGVAAIAWTTASETNADHFIVKKSTNGSSFTVVTSVKAAGNSTITHNYSVTDNNTGTNYKYIYYLIDIVDKDGRSSLSSIQKFTNTIAIKKLVTQINPNPVTKGGHLMFRFNADKESEMLVQVYNNNGKLVKQDKMYATQGLNNGHFMMNNLSSGVYSVEFSLDGLKETYKIVLQ